MRRLAALLLLPACPTFAAESYDACAGFIDTLPATISTQGTWCLRKDLVTSMTSGAAITISANNVTIDCSGFKLGGLPAGPETQASGLYAENRLNITVRNCTFRGFVTGVNMPGAAGGGHLVEDNRIDQSRYQGIRMDGTGNLIQRNRIQETAGLGAITAIYASADIRDNTIQGLRGDLVYGIEAFGPGVEVRGNRLRQFDGTMSNHGIALYDAQQSAVDNRLLATPDDLVNGDGIVAAPGKQVFCRDNLISNFGQGLTRCEDIGGNVVHGAASP